MGMTVYEAASLYWGTEKQLAALAEECCEVACAAMRFLNDKATLGEVREEVVDVLSLRCSLKDVIGEQTIWEIGQGHTGVRSGGSLRDLALKCCQAGGAAIRAMEYVVKGGVIDGRVAHGVGGNG